MSRKQIQFFIFTIFCFQDAYSQICACPGLEGPLNGTTVINTYYPPISNVILNSGSTNVQLIAVPPTDLYGNSYGNIPISACDLLLFIQVQDGLISTANSNLYGSNNANGGPDGLGGTGYINVGNAGLYEYAIALNSVSLSGGILNFRAAGNAGGLINNYYNNPGDGIINGKKTFQVIRIPQYSSLTMARDMICPPFNGSVGGIISFDVAGDLNFNGFKIDASLKGFRGGFQDVQLSDCNTANIYVTPTSVIASGKGESIAGTPRYMWDGYNEIDNGSIWNGFPGYSFGKGAPANAGGGGNDHNSGGGGGGNGGAGGVGGIGWQPIGFCIGDPGNPGGGRPGSNIISLTPSRLYFGGGGGGGDANNAVNGTKGGVGGGIVLITAGRLIGDGTILSNGGTGDRGVFLNNPDGAGGAGAGGTILVRVSNNSPASTLKLYANGGKGGNTIFDLNNEHGPGGGGGGGVIWHSITGTNITAEVNPGSNGLTNDGNLGGIPWGSKPGQIGLVNIFTTLSLPQYLQGQGSICFPTLNIAKSELNPGIAGIRFSGNNATYKLTIKNTGPGGGANGVILNDLLPIGFTYLNSSVTYSGGAIGPSAPVNTGSSLNPVLGIFSIPEGGSVTISMSTYINLSVLPGIYHNGTQALYKDPTRSISNPTRLITPKLYALNNQNITYETGVNNGIIVGGTNYNGASTGPNFEDVHIKAPGQIDIKVPRAFTPNNDGINDKLDVFLNGIVKLIFFKVFNRWGQLLFETNDPAQLWDGTFKGIPQPLETYVWIAEGLGDDGSSIVRRGQTILIR